jgi:hypothetical protein
VDSVGGRDIGNHRARFQNLPIHSGTEPICGWRQTGTVRVAMLTRHAVSVMNRRAVEINSAIAPRRAKDVSRACLHAFLLPLGALEERPPCIQQRPAHGRGGDRANPWYDDYMWSLPCRLTPACVLNAPVMATYSPGLINMPN